MSKTQKQSALAILLEGIEDKEGLEILSEYTPRPFKVNYLISLDLDKIKKDFGGSPVGLVDFVEIMFTQLFNQSKCRLSNRSHQPEPPLCGVGSYSCFSRNHASEFFQK
jgi:hypothetical protein